MEVQQNGPYAQRAGYGPVVEAMAGIADLTGEPDGPPMPTTYPIADNLAALLATTAINAALFWRERSNEGQYLDISLLDAVVQGNDYSFQQYLSSQGRVRTSRRGLHDDVFVPWGFFEGRDGWICIMCGHDAMWQALARVMERPDLAQDERFAELHARRSNSAILYPQVVEWVWSFESVDEIVNRLAAVGVPCGRINGVAEVLADPQIEARELVIERQHPTLGAMQILNSGIRMSRNKTTPPGAPPFLGEHNVSVLTELLGLSKHDFDELYASGALYCDPRVATVEGSAGP